MLLRESGWVEPFPRTWTRPKARARRVAGSGQQCQWTGRRSVPRERRQWRDLAIALRRGVLGSCEKAEGDLTLVGCINHPGMINGYGNQYSNDYENDFAQRVKQVFFLLLPSLVRISA